MNKKNFILIIFLIQIYLNSNVLTKNVKNMNNSLYPQNKYRKIIYHYNSFSMFPLEEHIDFFKSSQENNKQTSVRNDEMESNRNLKKNKNKNKPKFFIQTSN